MRGAEWGRITGLGSRLLPGGFMRKLSIALVASALLAATAPVMTVTNGSPDGNGHPYVGIALQAAPGGGFFVCSGSFLSPKKFMTASHCFDPTLGALVSAKNAPPFGSSLVSGTVHNNPSWCIGCGSGLQGFDTHDVALITLNAP